MEDIKIVLDGRLDEAAWESAKSFTGYKRIKSEGGEVCDVQTVCKVLPCKDRIYFGFYCEEPEMARVEEVDGEVSIWGSDRVELFISPSGTAYDYYQFITFFGRPQRQNYYAEGGQIQPDPYAPDWKSVVYKGENFWSIEMEIPLTAFYMTPNDNMSDTWLVNPTRCRTDPRLVRGYCLSSACTLERSFQDLDRFLVVDGFPLRPDEDDLRIVSAETAMKAQEENGYRGDMTVTVQCPVDASFRFVCDHTEETVVSLQAGKNEFTLPCFFEKLGRDKVSLALVRESDGKVFKRWYPVTIAYEPIKLQFTLPEYRCNFYPGQDYSQIAGKVIANKPITLKLEGPGIETAVITPEADGSFRFDTPNFQEGEAWLTATTDTEEKKQKIRRLAPSGRTMSWISGGNLIVNGEPVLVRKMFSPRYRGGNWCIDKYENENFHETRFVCQAGYAMVDPVLDRVLKLPKAEVFEDRMPSQPVLDYYAKMIDDLKDQDFVFYYIADEPECRGLSPVYMRNLYEFITERDPYHAINIVSRDARAYVESTDWIEAHPYFLPETSEEGRHVHGRPMNTLGGYIDAVGKLNRPDKCVGYLPQAYSYGNIIKTADYPTFDEIICSNWAGIIHGCKSVRPYAFGDLYDRPCLTEGYRYIFSSMEALEDFLLHGSRKVLLRTNAAEAVLYEHNGQQAFVLVNFNMEEQTVTVDGISGSWYNFRNGGELSGNTFTLKPLEVIIGTSQVRDAGLPTYQEVTALINTREAERIAGSSKLVPIYKDLEVTVCGGGRHLQTNWMKLFDGVRENLAINTNSSGERAVEIGFAKVDISFSKVIVHGWEVNDRNVVLQFKNNGQLETPEIDRVENKEHSVTFYLKETVSPQAMRFDFVENGKMEIYEIEVF